MTAVPFSLADLNARFLWTIDRRDSWRVLRGDGELQGDCDDYAVTALYILAGGWVGFWAEVATFRAVFWLVRMPSGAAHVALWRRGHGWIESDQRVWRPTVHPHRKRLPFLPPVVAIKLILGLFR